MQPQFVSNFDVVFYLGRADGQSHIDLVDLEQFLLLIGLQAGFSVGQIGGDVLDLGVDLIPLLLEVTLLLGVLLYLFIILAYLPDPLKVLMIVLDDRDVRFFVLILKLILALVLIIVLLLFVFLLVFLPITLLLLLLYLCLFLQFVYPLALPNLVVPDDPLPHLVIIGVDELPEDLLFLLELPLHLFIEDLHLAYFSGEMKVLRLQAGLL